MEDKKKLFVIITAILTAVAVGLTAASFSVDNWVYATAEPKNISSHSNSTDQKRQFGEISFGLFHGSRKMNYAFGDRSEVIKVVCGIKYCLLYCYKEHPDENALQKALDQFDNATATGKSDMYNYGLFPTSLLVTSILMAAVGIAWGLVYLAFAVYNIFGKPIETITGAMGLYLWNGLALLFTMMAVIIYLVLFFEYYSKSVLPRKDIDRGFQSTANLDFAFYMLVVAMCMYAINMGMLAMSGTRLQCAFTREAEKVMDGGMILY